jgi:hypothetical protein
VMLQQLTKMEIDLARITSNNGLSPRQEKPRHMGGAAPFPSLANSPKLSCSANHELIKLTGVDIVLQ